MTKSKKQTIFSCPRAIHRGVEHVPFVALGRPGNRALISAAHAAGAGHHDRSAHADPESGPVGLRDRLLRRSRTDGRVPDPLRSGDAAPARAGRSARELPVRVRVQRGTRQVWPQPHRVLRDARSRSRTGGREPAADHHLARDGEGHRFRPLLTPRILKMRGNAILG